MAGGPGAAREFGTVLFVDIVDSTRQLAAVGDEAWAALLDSFEGTTRDEIGRFAGVVIKMTGDGSLSLLPSPTAALSCACALHEAADTLGLALRAGVHTGEVQRREDDVAGIAVHIAARLMTLAEPGETLVSETVAALVAGGPFPLEARGPHRAKGLSEPISVYALALSARRTAVAPAALDLPGQLSPFVGREAELDALTALASDHRLLTITGPGGAGKTRIALAVAERLAEAHPESVTWVSLAELRDGEGVNEAIAKAVGIKSEFGRAAENLGALLSSRRTLLVIDNCEHLVDAVAATIDAMLRTAPSLSVVATSREALEVEGELTWRIPPLATRDGIELFIERAQRVRPDVPLDAADPMVAAICERLDGIPLAIELAAARVRSLALPRILDGLNDAIRLLTGGGRAAVPRQRTLAASIEWSHALLAPAEQVLLRRLSVFVGGGTLDDVEAIAADVDRSALDVVDGLDRLVAQSMVQLDIARGTTRYWLLETVRQFAEARLEGAGETASLVERHADHYLTVAREEGPDLNGPRVLDAMRRLAPEIDNLRAALATLERLGRWEDHADLMWSAEQIWGFMSPGELAGPLTRNLDRGSAEPARRARLHMLRARFGEAAGEAARRFADAAAVLELTDDLALRARAKAYLAEDEDLAEADRLLVEAIADSQAAHDPYREGLCRCARAWHWLFLGDVNTAFTILDEAVAAVAVDETPTLSILRDAHLAHAQWLRGEYESALDRTADARRTLVRIAAAIGMPPRLLGYNLPSFTRFEAIRAFSLLAMKGADAPVDGLVDVIAESDAAGALHVRLTLGPVLAIAQAVRGAPEVATALLEETAGLQEVFGGPWAVTCYALAATSARQYGDVARTRAPRSRRVARAGTGTTARRRARP